MPKPAGPVSSPQGPWRAPTSTCASSGLPPAPQKHLSKLPRPAAPLDCAVGAAAAAIMTLDCAAEAAAEQLAREDMVHTWCSGPACPECKAEKGCRKDRQLQIPSRGEILINRQSWNAARNRLPQLL
ncbi:hypothetical protein SKAU_G00204140 [Synaphobranchus kaupii]|uniref:Uncharacterized protein n=1 Tax=Synaphobranchus kaupii TaxID=118154 RepID=A0A9Q1FGF5_SYNKA|nr:hypothetical protein SKAU_G00204140 [Synaphobranchus kaupii]